ncbi:MAG: SRPBCC family protein [Gemmatimonas sp.]
MYWILFVMGALVSVVAALVMGGLATPRLHVASRRMVVRAPVGLVWRTVREVYAYADWRPALTEAVISIGDDGEEWRESTRGASTRFGVTVDEPPHRFGARILDDDIPYVGEWTWTFEPAGNGTLVTITVRGEIGNPMSRFIRTHMTGHAAPIDAYLAALATRVGSPGAEITDVSPR